MKYVFDHWTIDHVWTRIQWYCIDIDTLTKTTEECVYEGGGLKNLRIPEVIDS